MYIHILQLGSPNHLSSLLETGLWNATKHSTQVIFNIFWTQKILNLISVKSQKQNFFLYKMYSLAPLPDVAIVSGTMNVTYRRVRATHNDSWWWQTESDLIPNWHWQYRLSL